MLKTVLSQLALASTALAALVFAAQHVRPVYAGREPVVRQLLENPHRDSLALRAPWTKMATDLAVQTPQFERDRRAFYEDLMRTGQVTPGRADSLATFAVREAYRRRLPPALLFGVMLTENGQLQSTARSNVGAIGLMQIHAEAWVSSLGRFFGTDLRDDETNVRYGAFILSHFVYGAPDSLAADASVRRGLLRYNGCVRGSNTPRCHRYPDLVRKHVDTRAVSQCGDGGWEDCVGEPLRASIDGRNGREVRAVD